MKKNELVDLKGKTTDELRRLLLEKREELGKLKIDLSRAKSKDVNQVRNERKDIARILTILSIKEGEQSRSRQMRDEAM
ncbi:MAG: 50S ribosomal protein L29 [Candidatus Levybacteria bacterium RIFCSPHIGHO2_02_FULL_40_18]|nr:MAG: 50S ribosomal protein L29 [Candidatus Levybacteria bacterium RIFCSPHIGHO2_01_FULL_40_58]OGH26392.1 MAG: 50S ribosomal protein L29 [Candidatus Levybacteria bacterium RIFCSPHIGHO2_02_FULL_40_18]OGH31839.1 MAG: 50S ribosomal protein L29 [Candidatus Levybacteria bacterium RIFCSPHIGHO2_12_FULL_40_31]OGH40472.1 MAG: 50S ribosomal protein L29 [Candidatus Levybacteria bacterium RIFCSPLOWO2_01_FULL_40_64]OGH49181.1 MAG: 50S ribosomal protein L29 [Candidatus Levybacteria bacterium RIFCSPLOWO2_02_